MYYPFNPGHSAMELTFQSKDSNPLLCNQDK
jgi:hypothetical protein